MGGVGEGVLVVSGRSGNTGRTGISNKCACVPLYSLPLPLPLVLTLPRALALCAHARAPALKLPAFRQSRRAMQAWRRACVVEHI